MFRIRQARESDATAMARMTVDTWLEAHKGQIPAKNWERRRDEWTYDVSERGWRETLQSQAADPAARDFIYLAVETTPDSGEEAIVGICYAGPPDKGPWPDGGEIYMLYVRTDRHRQGIGRALVRAAVGRFLDQDVAQLVIPCLEANHPARAFYESLGGVIVGESENEDYGYRNKEVLFGWEEIGEMGVGRPMTPDAGT